MRKLILIKARSWKIGIRSFSAAVNASEAAEEKKCHNRMKGWQIHNYSDNIQDNESLQHSEMLKKPFIRKPSELLVKVSASSVNPIDVAMMSEF